MPGDTADENRDKKGGLHDSLHGLQIKLCRCPSEQKGLGNGVLRNKLDLGLLSTSWHPLAVQRGGSQDQPERSSSHCANRSPGARRKPCAGWVCSLSLPRPSFNLPSEPQREDEGQDRDFPGLGALPAARRAEHSVSQGLRGVTFDVHAENSVLHVRHGQIQLLVAGERDQVPVFIWIGQRTPSGARPVQQRDAAPPPPPSRGRGSRRPRPTGRAPRPAHPYSACGTRAAARPAAAPGKARRRGRGRPGSGREASGRSGGSRGSHPPCPAGRLSPSAPPWLWRSRNCRRDAGLRGAVRCGRRDAGGVLRGGVL